MLDRIVLNSGIKIQYKIKKGIGIPLIFLHGGGGSLAAWEIILPLFKDYNATFITIDFRGHGLSDRSQNINDYRVEKHVDDIHTLLKREKLKKVILIGHCFGSMVAATYASFFPAEVEKLVLINTGYELPWFIVKTPVFLTLRFIANIGAAFVPNKKGTERVNYFKYQGTSDINLPRLLSDLQIMGVAAASKQFLATLKWDGRYYFPRLKVPTLIVAGRKDSIYPIRMTEEVRKLIKDVKLEYIDSNHISIINNPKKVFEKIDKFLKK